MNREEQLNINLRKKQLQAELQKRKNNQFIIEDIPLDPNKIMNTLPPFERPKELGPKQTLPIESRAQTPSMAGFTTPGTLGGRLIAKGPQIIGGTLGGMAGAAIPSIGEEPALAGAGTALGQWGLAPLLAAGGGVAGRAMTLDPQDPHYGQKLLFAALEEAGGEYAGRLLSAGLGRTFLRPFRGAVIPEGEIADQALRQAGIKTAKQPRTWIGKTGRGIRRGIYKTGQRIKGKPGAAARLGKQYGAHLLPGQTTESFMDTLQAVAEGSFFGGGAMRRFQTQTQRAALENLQSRLGMKVRQNLIKKVGTKKAAAILTDLSNADSATLKEIGDSLYQVVDDIAKAGRSPATGQFVGAIDFKPVKEVAKAEIDRWTKAGQYRGARRVMLKSIADNADKLDFATQKDIRSQLLSYARQFDMQGKNIDRAIARRLAGAVDDAMEQGARAISPQAEAAWRTANEFYRGRLRTEWLADTLAKYGKAEDVATGKGFVNYIAKMTKEINGKPSELAKMGFSTDEIKQIRNVANATKFVGERAIGGGRMLVQIAQGGAIVGLGTGMFTDQPAITYPSAVILIGPTLLARLMLSPTGSKLLSTGLRAPAGTRTIGTLGVRLAREAAYHETERRMKGEPPQLWLRYISIPEQKIKEPSLKQLRGFGGRGF